MGFSVLLLNALKGLIAFIFDLLNVMCRNILVSKHQNVTLSSLLIAKQFIIVLQYNTIVNLQAYYNTF